MKKITLILILLLITVSSFAEEHVAVDDASYPEEVTFEKAIYPHEINVPHALWRGTLNAFTCWLEIPREIIIENNHYPLFGIVSGTLRGAFFTTSRAVLSFVDIGLLGFTGPSAYDPYYFPEYVWNCQWNPYSKNPTSDILDSQDEFTVHSASMGTAK